MSSAVDRKGMRARREKAKAEFARAAAVPHGAAESKEDQDALECWICYSGTDGGELVSPCKCRGSMRWVHRECLHTWITTRVTEYEPNQWVENGRQAPDRFACPNCETRFEFVSADGQPTQPNAEIWPASRWWFLPNVFPSIGRLAEIDAEVCDNFRWKCGAPLACTMVQLVLVGFTFVHLVMLAMSVNDDGWGGNLELRDVTRAGLQSSPVLKNTLDFFFGSKVVGDPIMGEDTIGTISEKWSATFAAIQHAHAMLVSCFPESPIDLQPPFQPE